MKRVGCVGMCHQTPLVEIVPPSGPAKLFAKVRPDAVRSIVLAHFKPRGLGRRIGYAVSSALDRLLTDEPGDHLMRHAIDVRDDPVCAFLGRQRRVATEYCGQIDPTGPRRIPPPRRLPGPAALRNGADARADSSPRSKPAGCAAAAGRASPPA